MSYLFVGLGNPGTKYDYTRHNAGRLVLEDFQKYFEFTDWRKEKKAGASFADGVFSEDDVTLCTPENYMNRSGESVRKLVKNPKDAKRMVVVHDEIDLPIGQFKIVFGKGAGGHNGVQSIINHVHTKDFIRIRVGVSPINWFGRMKKPQGRGAVTDFLLSDFKNREIEKLQSLYPELRKASEMIVAEGYEKAMNAFNDAEGREDEKV